MRTRFPALVLAAIFLSCRPTPKPVLSPTAPACDNYCKTLEFYACEESKPPRRGRTCLQRCQTVEETGYMSLGPQCVIDNSDSLSKIRSLCNVKCEQGKE